MTPIANPLKGLRLPPPAHLDPRTAAARKKRTRAYDPDLTPDALRLWRVSKNLETPIWSQEYTAKWLGVSLRMYRRWEAGNYRVPLYISNRINEAEALLKEISDLKRILRLNNIAP